MTTLNNEISKLCAYVLQDGRNAVTENDVYTVSAAVNEVAAFDFSNALLYGDAERALIIMRDMRLRKDPP